MNDEARAELQTKINRSIPLSEAMGYCITELDDDQIAVSAPLAPNINIHGTGFAGSIYALGILTAWGLCSHLLDRAGIAADLVVAQATVRYRTPVRGDILCRCRVEEDAAKQFIQDLNDKGRSRMVVMVICNKGAARIEATLYARLLR